MSTITRFAALLLCCFFIAAGAQAAELNVNKIAAVVNGEMITLHELRKHTDAELARRNIPKGDPRAAAVQSALLDSMISDILLRQEAKRYNVTISNAEVEAEIAKIIEQNKGTRKEFEAQLVKQGGSLELYKESLHNNMLRGRMLTQMVARRVTVTPEEIADYYKNHKDEFVGKKTIDFSLVLLPENLKIQDIYTKLQSGAMSFEECARKYSIDKTAQNEGRVDKLPWDRLPPELQKLMGPLADGKMTPLLKTKGAFYIFKRRGMSDAKPETLAEATPRIESILREPRLDERFKEYTAQLRAKAVVDIRI